MKKEIEKYHYNQTGAELILYEDDVILVEYARATYNVEENNEETRWIRDAFYKVAEKYPKKKFKIILDVTKPGSGEEMSDEVKEIYVQLLKDPKILKVAVFGQTWAFQLFLDLFAALSRNNKLKSFPSMEKAVAWINK
ncbi:MAG: hypothetical protein ABH835_01345 [Patescibacteria group bacterium]|nr:hypothetical protein [Patescibacteria group bacterium]